MKLNGFLIRLRASAVNGNTKDELEQEFGILQDYKVRQSAVSTSPWQQWPANCSLKVSIHLIAQNISNMAPWHFNIYLNCGSTWAHCYYWGNILMQGSRWNIILLWESVMFLMENNTVHRLTLTKNNKKLSKEPWTPWASKSHGTFLW